MGRAGRRQRRKRHGSHGRTESDSDEPEELPRSKKKTPRKKAKGASRAEGSDPGVVSNTGRRMRGSSRAGTPGNKNASASGDDAGTPQTKRKFKKKRKLGKRGKGADPTGDSSLASPSPQGASPSSTTAPSPKTTTPKPVSPPSVPSPPAVVVTDSKTESAGQTPLESQPKRRRDKETYLVSYLTTQGKASVLADGSVRIVIDRGESLCFHGRVCVEVLSGVLKVFGHVITKDSGCVKMHSPSWSPNSLLKLEPATLPGNDGSAVVILSECRSALIHETSQTRSHLDDVNIVGFHPVVSVGMDGTRFSSVFLSNAWTEAAYAIFAADAPLVLVCGDRNTGKSTFSRFLVNVLLNKSESVIFLEADVGQCELSPPGLVSAHLLKAPLLGPPHTHMRRPLCSFFHGSSSPSTDPSRYLDCVAKTLTHVRQHLGNVPVIVNTCGWVKGLGLDLLQSIATQVQPSHVVELRKTPSPTSSSEVAAPSASLLADLLPNASHTLLPQGAPERKDVDRSKVSARVLRELALVSYFGAGFADDLQIQEEDCTVSFSSIGSVLAARNPFCVAWADVSLRVLGKQVAVTDYLFSLNGSVVALCEAEDPSLQAAPCGLRVLSNEENLRCVGLGIIRSIDVQSRSLYLLTPLSARQLAKVTVLLKGHLPLPAAFFHCGSGIAPYLSWSGGATISTEQVKSAKPSGDSVPAGMQTMNSRNNLLRRRLSHGTV